MRHPVEGFRLAVTPCDVNRSLRLIVTEPGFVLPCVCGAARFCTGRHAFADAAEFRKLHKDCRPKPPEAA